MKKFCKICRKKIKHNKDLEICENCLKRGFQAMKEVLNSFKKDEK